MIKHLFFIHPYLGSFLQKKKNKQKNNLLFVWDSVLLFWNYLCGKNKEVTESKYVERYKEQNL